MGATSMEEAIAEVVRQHGWYAASISDHQPPFLYSIGLMQTFDHPDFIVLGLERSIAHALFSHLVLDMRAGRSYSEPGVFSVAIGDDQHQVGLRRVHPTRHELYLGFAMGYHRHIGRSGEFQAMQVFWPDGVGKFPFEVGCDLEVYQLQPRLDIGLSPEELRRWRRQWE
jgi:hypothetical protein